MFRRFLNNNDYKSLISKEHLDQILRGDYSKLMDAESNAEISLIEYLSENYEIEKELYKGKYIVEYDRKITFPVGAYFYLDSVIYEVIRSIAGYQKPTGAVHWQEYVNQLGRLPTDTIIKQYSQFETYQPKDLVSYNGIQYFCLKENGYRFDDIRLPMLKSWAKVEYLEWQPIDYIVWDIVKFEDNFYALTDTEGFDNNHTPFESDCWGLIAEYDPEHTTYDYSGHDFVVHNGQVFIPELNVNSDEPIEGVNISPNDPRNQNIKKHLSRIATYEISKLIAANNVSTFRIEDYKDSISWLLKASKLQINPHIPRKLDKENKPILDWQLATFQTEFDPYKNMWLT